MGKQDRSFTLRDDYIIATVAQLHKRIEDRFPDSGLAASCYELLRVSQQTARRARAIARPMWWLRIASVLVPVTLVLAIVAAANWLQWGAQAIDAGVQPLGPSELIQAVDSGISDIVFLFAAIIFMFTLETRLKRRWTLEAIHELRSIAHVIDMHQLTKDPERLLQGYADAKHSPRRKMSPLQMNRYLDYCSEMLSLTGKVAALYVEDFDDSDAVQAVSDLEALTTGLSRKIWQKLMILQQQRDAGQISFAESPAETTPVAERRAQTGDPAEKPAASTGGAQNAAGGESWPVEQAD